MNDSPLLTVPSETAADKPRLESLRELIPGPLGIRSIALTGLFVLALFYTLYFARGFFLSVTVALLLSFLFSPVVRALKRAQVPESIGALLVLVAVLGTAAAAIYSLSGPVAEWLERAPVAFRKAERALSQIRKPVETVTQATQEVEKLTSLGGERRGSVQIRQQQLSDTLITTVLGFFFELMVVVILLYFLLASGDLFLRKLITVLPKLADKKRAVQIARDVEQNISTYLFTITVINAVLGLVTAGVMAWLGMPNPLLWGALAGVSNFIPYIGAIGVAGVLGLVALTTFGSVAAALVPPLVFLTITSIEGYLVTPWVLGRRLTLNPVMVFLNLMFWGWVWGLPGGFLAVPILATFKIFCDHIEPLAPLGEFLGD
jgi:predicted PurR-regulated permease PerM